MPDPSRATTAGRVFNDLRNLGRRTGRNTSDLLLAYGLERLLFRISMSEPQSFILKGGLLLSAFDVRRTTGDIDVLGRGLVADEAGIRATVKRLAEIPFDDGIVFGTDEMKTATIRADADYIGTRLTMPATVARAKIKISLDINFGDPVTPGPRLIELPQLLSTAPFTLLGYPVETVIAEKLTTAVLLGDASTRDRDYADLYRLITRHDLSGSSIAAALRNTAAYRKVRLRPLTEVLDTLASPAGCLRRLAEPARSRAHRVPGALRRCRCHGHHVRRSRAPGWTGAPELELYAPPVAMRRAPSFVLTAVVKAIQAPAWNTRAGPLGFLLSRMAIRAAPRLATSTQAPLPLLCELFRQVAPASSSLPMFR